jgi:hypothetical protein
MEEIYVCDQQDRENIVNVIQYNTDLYGIDIRSSGIMDMHISKIDEVLSGKFPGKIIGHHIDNKFIGFGIMYFWAKIPFWSIPISYTSYDLTQNRKISRSYSMIMNKMMLIAEEQNAYDFYYVSRHVPVNLSRNRLLSQELIFDRYHFHPAEIIEPFGNSKYEIYQSLMSSIANKSKCVL